MLRGKLFPAIIVLFVLSCSSLIVSVNAVPMWNQTNGGTGDDFATAIIETSYGGYAVAGITYTGQDS